MRTLAVLLVLALIWTAGLFAFAERVRRSTPAPQPEAADGIVALTGAGSNERIAAGMRLLEAGLGDRMLISGVNREASREDIRNVSRAVQLLYDCCVDLGFEAADTFGNAQETAGWVRARRYDSLIVVTADYHIPRAMLELGSALPQTRLTAFPVATPSLDAERWWRTTGGARLMVTEYMKYLAIFGREALRRLDRTSESSAAPSANAEPKTS